MKGLVTRPLDGAHEEGVSGFLKGVGQGLMGAVAAPVVGTLGAISKVTEGVDASTTSLSSKKSRHNVENAGVKRRRRKSRTRSIFTSHGRVSYLPVIMEKDYRIVRKEDFPSSITETFALSKLEKKDGN